ncbi:hypothetical protein CORC01_04849 [Colletotrichum orchidophilum]|uniref:Uncharacterized protein n=1 Tax=Colletotrichum orchidophilum TaxID=1209926 RepID=A0A1G4BF07_9PEZI|nr:uncharacterized protein CORC01_04849 [Colletotrichum orchidophilum]OHE99948.1 hypothetical protein CORC01_04849 [Colletotrichum orchidophilum]
MAKSKSNSRSSGKGSVPKMMTADGLDHPISLKLCKRLNRFFEALTLLYSLFQACPSNGQHSNKTPSDVAEPGENHRTFMECFMNKLAQICDNEHGGENVTSVAMIQLPDSLRYTFASNQRSAEEIAEVEAFVLSIFKYLSKASATISTTEDDVTSNPFHHILGQIVFFHRKRIQCYRDGLVKTLSQCIEDCDRREPGQDSPVKQELLKLQCVADKSMSSAGDCASKERDEALVRAATELRQSIIYNSIVDRGKSGKFDESQYWCELQHFIGRLVSYQRATHTIFVARRRYPELFDIDGIQIKFIASSKRLPNPMNAFQAGLIPMQRNKIRSAHNILSRMTGDEEMMKTYQQYADELQRCHLDQIIEKQCCNKKFKPIVHSEVLLLDWLCKEFAEERHSVPFYGGNKYIGCSKPTCRLCEYYFAAHNSGVRVRPTHQNVYPSWIVPDALEEGEISKIKDKIIDAVLAKVREDAFTALREKVSERKRFDSDTYSSMPTSQSLTGISVTLDDLSFRIGGLSISPHPRIPPIVVKSRLNIFDDTWSVAAHEDYSGSEDDNSGVLVFTGRNKRS